LDGSDVLPFGPLGGNTLHLCIDMQNVFADELSPWYAPWINRVLPVVTRLVARHPERTILTRFMPPNTPEEMSGSWRRYYERWKELTRSRADPHFVELVPQLALFAPPATVLDKMGYSPFHGTDLARSLRGQNVDTVVITGTETDMCVAAAVLDAVDMGLRVVVAEDGLCSSSDTTHDALMTLYRERFGQQIETAKAETILLNWL
jgi:nicotinamidase-related amidase